MVPLIRDGDVVTVSPFCRGDVQHHMRRAAPHCGDVVAYIQPDTSRLVIHRVVCRKGNAYLIKGDNTSQMDGLVPQENILGYVTRVERRGREVALGFGPEKYLIAFLTRRGSIRPLLAPIWRYINPYKRR